MMRKIDNQSKNEPAYENYGKLVGDSFSSRSPKIKASRFRLAFKHQIIRYFTYIALILGGLTAGAFLLGWMIVGIVLAIPFVLGLVILTFILMKTAVIFENAALVPAIVVDQEKLQIISMANMNTGASDKEIIALKLVECLSIPVHRCEVGEVIPCVAGFQGDGFDRWDDFSPEPLSYATGNRKVLAENESYLEKDELDLLRKMIPEVLPRMEVGKVFWLEELSSSPAGK